MTGLQHGHVSVGMLYYIIVLRQAVALCGSHDFKRLCEVEVLFLGLESELGLG